HVNGLAKAFNLKKKSSGGNSGGFLYLVQIGAFSNLENARTLENQAKGNGFDAYVKPEGSLYKVQIGAFSDKKNADQLKRRAENAGFDVFITN
ncbi:MAG TPA: SPOR domain-containing protein, partial [Bacteroidales bacterium]|nr:SPOR domain-containing protein [Bacteroidales bacterium]